MVRAPFYDQKGLKKGAWSPEEDEKLRNYAHKYGCCNWRQLPQLAGLKRCGKSCRLRWMNYLKPDLRHGSFSQKEDDLILQLHQQLGNRWSLIAAALPGRTDNEIKNHWHTHLRKLNQTSSSGSRKDPEPNPAQTLLLSRSESAGSCTYLSADDLPHPILESSPLSPEISYSSAGASSSTSTDGSDPGPVASEHDLGPSETLVRNGTGCGDFWTEPFVVENASSNRPDLLLYHEEPVDDLFYQVMQEFPDM